MQITILASTKYFLLFHSEKHSILVKIDWKYVKYNVDFIKSIQIDAKIPFWVPKWAFFPVEMYDAIFGVGKILKMSIWRNFWRFFFSKKLVSWKMTQFSGETQFLTVQ